MAIPATANNADPNLDPAASSANGRGTDGAQVPPPLPPQPSSSLVEASDPNAVLKQDTNLTGGQVKDESRPVDLSSVNESLRGDKQDKDAIAHQKSVDSAPEKQNMPMNPGLSKDPNAALESTSEVSKSSVEGISTEEMDTHKTLPQGIVEKSDVGMDETLEVPSVEKPETKSKSQGNMLLIVLLFLSIIALVLAGVLVYVYLLSPQS